MNGKIKQKNIGIKSMESKNYIRSVITLDGPAGSGKSTIAKMLAQELNYIHVDSGAIYRGYTYAVIKKIGLFSSPDEFCNELEKHNIKPEMFDLEVKFENNTQKIFLQNLDITSELRTRELTQRIKYIADNVLFRKKVNQILRTIAKNYPIIVDGRDMGTEVFTETKYKFYLDANIEVRAQRRYNEYLNNKNHEKNTIDIEDIKKEILKRDEDDKRRKIGALKIPPDAIMIDTSYLSRKMVMDLLIVYLQYKF